MYLQTAMGQCVQEDISGSPITVLTEHTFWWPPAPAAPPYSTLYHGMAIYREVTFANVTSVAENTDTMLQSNLHLHNKKVRLVNLS